LSLLPDALKNTQCYAHTTAQIKLIETHLSWVFLTGDYVYKVKKPVNFDFVDFSTLERRLYFCHEEVRCNALFAPELYLGVVCIVRRAGEVLVVSKAEHGDEIVDYAVQMYQFDDALQADKLLQAGQLTLQEMREFGVRLGSQHLSLPELTADYRPGEAILDNFDTLHKIPEVAPYREKLVQLEHQARAELKRYADLLNDRREQHWVRECHGDLHLSNLARLSHGITAFDCLEFDESLRHIDFWCDAGFLFMDCCNRDRADLAYAFVDGYLSATVDYQGLLLLPMFAAYRSVVRAKIAGLRFAQAHEPEVQEKLIAHLNWPLNRLKRPLGRIYVTCGLSGSGKSYWAERLLPTLPALRLRSDLWRKASHGLSSRADSGSSLGSGLYAADQSEAVYVELGQLAGALAERREHVIVDVAALRHSQRQILYEAAAEVGAQITLLYFTAPKPVLRERITQRYVSGEDPSEADHAVLNWQLENFEAPRADEHAVHLDSTNLDLEKLRAALA
jgi:aminoglycoside phosphotransferase family enzyme/predicted kinase